MCFQSVLDKVTGWWGPHETSPLRFIPVHSDNVALLCQLCIKKVVCLGGGDHHSAELTWKYNCPRYKDSDFSCFFFVFDCSCKPVVERTMTAEMWIFGTFTFSCKQQCDKVIHTALDIKYRTTDTRSDWWKSMRAHKWSWGFLRFPICFGLFSRLLISVVSFFLHRSLENQTCVNWFFYWYMLSCGLYSLLYNQVWFSFFTSTSEDQWYQHSRPKFQSKSFPSHKSQSFSLSYVFGRFVF